jgi:hypothetical protein
VLLAIDRADAIWGSELADELFGLVRAWAENAAEPGSWSSLRLILAVSTTPALLIRNPSQSPFNLTQPIRLGDLDREQVRELARLHRVSLSEADIDRLMELVGGHPDLVRLALYAMATGTRLEQVLDGRGVFDEVFAQWVSRFARQPELAAAFATVARGESAPIEPMVEQRLISAGLIVKGDRGRQLRCRLYRQLVAA